MGKPVTLTGSFNPLMGKVHQPVGRQHTLTKGPSLASPGGAQLRLGNKQIRPLPPNSQILGNNHTARSIQLLTVLPVTGTHAVRLYLTQPTLPNWVTDMLGLS